MLDNPLLKRKLSLKDVKSNLIGHWGTVPGQNFVYVHLNRVIKKYDLNMIYISGPGHGGQAMVANNYLEGVYTKFYPEITEDDIWMLDYGDGSGNNGQFYEFVNAINDYANAESQRALKN